MGVHLFWNTRYAPLILVVKFLMSLRKTGEISLSSNPANKLYFNEGSLIHAIYNDTTDPEEALKLFLTLTGEFQFIEGLSFEKITMTESVDNIINEALSDWEKLKELLELIPLNDVTFSIVPFDLENTDETIVFSREEWVIISQISRKPLFIDSIKDIKLSSAKIGEILVSLYNKGYIEFHTTMEACKDITELLCLRGDLSKFKLKNILSLLFTINGTGNLKIISGDRQADIYLEDGNILDAKTNSWSLDMAMAECLTWETGNFSFHKFIRQDNSRRLLTIRIEEIVNDFTEKVEKLIEITKTFKSSNVILKINEDSSDADDEDMYFDQEDWNMMLYINGKRTLNDLSVEMNVPLYIMAANMYDFYKHNLVLPLSDEDVSKQDLSGKKDESVLSQISPDIDRELQSFLYQEDSLDAQELKKLKASIFQNTDDEELNGSLSKDGDNLISILHEEISDDEKEKIKTALFSPSEDEGDLSSILQEEISAD
ncbi:MAG: DUF4388 domain-containing protein, partial [Candidatus Eremiobacterota bacterium]